MVVLPTSFISTYLKCIYEFVILDQLLKNIAHLPQFPQSIFTYKHFAKKIYMNKGVHLHILFSAKVKQNILKRKTKKRRKNVKKRLTAPTTHANIE